MNEEIKNKAQELTDEEIEKAAGGANFNDDTGDYPYYYCPHCFQIVYYKVGQSKPKCKCGYNPKTGEVDPPSNNGPSEGEAASHKIGRTSTSMD